MSIPNTLLIPENFAPKTSVVELDIEGRVSKQLSYEQLIRASTDLLDGPATSILRKGNTAALFIPNGTEFVVVALALLRRGMVVLPLNPALKMDQITGILDQVKPVVVIGTEGNADSLRSASGGEIRVLTCPKLENDPKRDGDDFLKDFVLGSSDSNDAPSAYATVDGDAVRTLGPDNPAVLLFTSGTTGSPKGVSLTHRNILTSIDIISQAHQLTEHDTCMLITPLFHVAGFCASMLLTLITGGTLVIQPPGVPSSRFWQDLIQHDVTWFHAVPALLKILLKFDSVTEFKHTERNPLRFVRCGGSPLSNDLLQEAEAATGKPLLEIYGLTESSPGIFCNKVDSPVGHQAGMFPIPSQVELKIVVPEPTALSGSLATLSLESNNEVDSVAPQPDVGELCLRGPSIITEYVYADAASNVSSFDTDGFFRTGDLTGRVGQDGKFVQLRGRLKEAVNKGGEKINPAEVDNVIIQHDDIVEAACFAAQDEEFGEDICAAVIVKPYRDVSTLKLQQSFRKDLRRFLRKKLVGFQIPRDIHFVDSLPKTALGKYKRRELTERYGKLDLAS
ncbi:Fc.00g114200.m01.CDS01 [Cosmosporella sp. VM-42]